MSDTLMSRAIATFLIALAFASGASAAVTSAEGIDIYWISEGDGPALVFVHGWTCDTTVWADQLTDFRDDYRVVALDLPGHGLSGSTMNGTFTVELYAAAVEAVRLAAGVDEMVLVGHSMGAPVISRYAIDHPDRVAGVVAVDGSLLPAGDPPPQQQAPDGSMRQFREQLVRSMFVPETSAQIQDRVLHMMLGPPDEQAVALGSAMFTFSADASDSIAAPALVVLAGTAEEPDTDSLRALAPDATIERIDGTGHFLMMEKPAEFNDLLRTFLQDIDF